MRVVYKKLFSRHALAAAFFLAALGWYLRCAAPTLYWGDSAEMTSVACSAGVAHSPGYPLLSIAGRLFLWMPLPLPFAANLSSVFFAAIAIGALFLFLSKYSGLRFAAVIGTAMFATVPSFIFQSLFIEVYALHVALFCVALYMLAANERSGDTRWFLAALLTLSFGMTHHILMYFAMASFLVYCLLRSHEERTAAVPLLLFFAYSFMNVLTTHSLATDYIAYYKWTLAAVAALYVCYIILLGKFARARFDSSAAHTAACLLIFTVAASIFIYLPLVSARAPVADWWSPDTPGNFMNLLFLRGYPPTFPKTVVELIKRLDIQGLLYQMPPAASWVLALVLGLASVSKYMLGIGIAAIVMILIWKRGQLAVMLLLCGSATFVGALLVKHGKPEALRIPVYLCMTALTAMLLSAFFGMRFWCVKKWRVVLVAPFYIVFASSLALAFVEFPNVKDFKSVLKGARFSSRADARMMANSGSAYELGERIISDAAPESILFIGQQTPSIMGYFEACEPERVEKKKLVIVPISFLSFDWKVDRLRDTHRGIYFPPVIKKPDDENFFTAGGVDRITYAADMIRANPEIRRAYSDTYFIPLGAGFMSLPRGAIYLLAPSDAVQRSTAFTCEPLMKLLDARRTPKWNMLDKRDRLAAENISSIHNERGKIYFEYGSTFNCPDMIYAARAEFDRALSIFPDDADATSNKARAIFYDYNSYDTKPLKEAVKLHRRAISLRPDDPEMHNEFAQTLLQTHTVEDASMAVEELMKSLVLQPKQPRVFYSLGNAFVLIGNKESAIKFFNAAIQAQPDYLEAYRAISRLYGATGDCRDALAMLETAVGRAREVPDPKASLDLRCELATRYSLCGFDNLFRQTMRDMSLDFKHDLTYYQAVGAVYRNTGHIKDTVAVYRRAAREFPGSGFKLGNLFISLTPDECETSLPLVKQAVDLEPNDFSIRLLYGSNLCICDRLRECEEELNEAKRIDPKETGVDMLLQQLHRAERNAAMRQAEEDRKRGAKPAQR